MTFVGHSLTGVSLAVLVVPQAWRPRAKAALAVAFAGLANLPDLRVPYWGHERYEISHSLIVNTGLIFLLSLGLLAIPGIRRTKGAVWLLTGGALAWLSHLLLDSFYGHGYGIAIFWPFSRARLNLPIPWFETVRQPLPHIDSHTARVWLVELLVYGGLCAAAWGVRQVCIRRRTPSRQP